MKVFGIAYSHAYGLGAQIIVAKDEDTARALAATSGAWTGFTIIEIDTTNEKVYELEEC